MSRPVSARVPDETAERVEHLVERDEFETRSEAVAELLTERVEEIGVELPVEDEDEDEDEVEIEEEDDEAAIPETATTEPVTEVVQQNPPQKTFLSGARAVLGEIASYTLPEVPLAALAGGWVVYGGGAQVLGIPTLLAPVFAVSLVLGAVIA